MMLFPEEIEFTLPILKKAIRIEWQHKLHNREVWICFHFFTWKYRNNQIIFREATPNIKFVIASSTCGRKIKQIPRCDSGTTLIMVQALTLNMFYPKVHFYQQCRLCLYANNNERGTTLNGSSKINFSTTIALSKFSH